MGYAQWTHRSFVQLLIFIASLIFKNVPFCSVLFCSWRVVCAWWCLVLGELGRSTSMGLDRGKIAFWRQNIPEAAGEPTAENLLEVQRALQLEANWAGGGAGDAVQYGDLIGWRQRDLQDCVEQDPVGTSTLDPRHQ